MDNMVIFGLGMLMGGFISGFVLSLFIIYQPKRKRKENHQ